MSEFQKGIVSLLKGSIDEPFLELITSEQSIEKYFKRVFRIGSTLQGTAAFEAKFDYEVLEKVGDRVLSASFQIYLFDLMGDTVNTPQTYADMEKVLLNTTNLSYLADELEFNRFSNFEHPRKSVKETKEDMFEAFVGAIALAGDEFVSQDFGLVLAKRWIYNTFNTYMRDRIDPSDPGRYVDYITQISEIWTLNNWGPVLMAYKPKDIACGSKQSSYNIMGPNHPTFPKEYRDKVIGYGIGDSNKEAKEEAHKMAAKTLTISFKNFETQYDNMDRDRMKKLLIKSPDLLKEVITLLDDESKGIKAISIKKISLRGHHFAQVIARFNDSHYQNLARAESKESMETAIIKAFQGGLKVLRDATNR